MVENTTFTGSVHSTQVWFSYVFFFYHYGIISFLKEDQDTGKAVAPKRVSG